MADSSLGRWPAMAIQMELKTRKDLEAYAAELCLPLMERTARRRLDFTRTTVNDSAGYLLTFAEAFCRPLWGIGPILRDRDLYMDIRGRKTEVCAWIREVLTAAADPQSPYTWRAAEGVDPVSYANQMKTELAGLMVGIFLAKEKLWDPIAPADQKKIADWIYEINEAAYRVVWDCNHIWFIVLNLTVLKRLGFIYEHTDQYLREGLDRLENMYVGGGFYQDGKFGRFDYYNPWAMQTYPLLWAMLETEEFEGYKERKARFIRRAEAFLPYYAHWFDSTGCHIPFGRSLAYRFAASALFPMAVYSGCQCDPGLARSITLKNIGFFAQHGELENGVLPPGFLYNAPQAVENYTSDGGAYWCVKAFLCLLMPEEHPFWMAESAKLPAERGSFIAGAACDRIHMPVAGDENSGVTLYNNTSNYLQDQLKTQFFLDMAGFYSKFAYNSRAGFGISTRDSVSFDNMVSLATPDLTLESHRLGFEDLGCQKGVLKSVHIPFANDPGTSITTWVLPLEGSLHVRVHRVRLSQPYRLREGGFTVPMNSDRKRVESGEGFVWVESENLTSALWSFSPVSFSVKGVQPGMHLLSPMAVYPACETGVLASGDYAFAAAACVSSGGLPSQVPQVRLEKNGASVGFKGNLHNIAF